MKYFEKYGKVIAMTAAALGMTAALTIESSLAYFTTYVSAGGSEVVSLGAQTTIHEDVSLMTKHITIRNTSQINDCFVRVKVFCPDGFTVEFTDVSGGDNWYEGEDGYWYYRPILPASTEDNASLTTVLDAKINVPEGFDRDDFNVVVIQECTPVVYDEDGNATADWSRVYSEYEDEQEDSGRLGEEADW